MGFETSMMMLGATLVIIVMIYLIGSKSEWLHDVEVELSKLAPHPTPLTFIQALHAFREHAIKHLPLNANVIGDAIFPYHFLQEPDPHAFQDVLNSLVLDLKQDQAHGTLGILSIVSWFNNTGSVGARGVKPYKENWAVVWFSKAPYPMSFLGDKHDYERLQKALSPLPPEIAVRVKKLTKGKVFYLASEQGTLLLFQNATFAKMLTLFKPR